MNIARLVSALAFVVCAFTPLTQAFAEQGAQAPSNAAPRWQQTTNHYQWSVSIQPRLTPIPLGAFHAWVITLTDKTKPIANAKISVNAGMPEHGHGMPSQPMVTQYLGEGQYLLEGVKFNMAGKWAFQFNIEATTTDSGEWQADQVEFKFEIGH